MAEASYRQALIDERRTSPKHTTTWGTFLRSRTGSRKPKQVCTGPYAIKPDYTEAHYNLGNALKEQGRLAEAEASYARALIIAPHYAKAHNNLGNVLKEQGRLAEAEVSLNMALSIRA